MNSYKFSGNINKVIGNRFSMGILATIAIIVIFVSLLSMEANLKQSLLIALVVSFALVIYASYVWVTENENHIRTLPQTWTSSGLLGTFITLTISFYSINILPDEKLDINSIIHGLSLAFITSIFGIIGSQIMNIIISKKYDNKDKKDNIKETPEKMLMDLRNNTQDGQGALINSLRNIENILSNSQYKLSSLDGNFSNMKNDITKLFSGAMDNFNTSMQGDISKINEDLKNHVIKIQHSFEKTTKDSVEEYKNNNIEIEKEMRINLNTILLTQKDEFLNIQKDFKSQMNAFLIEVKDGNKKALTQQKDEAEQRSKDVKVISDTIVESGEETKISLDKIISEINLNVTASIDAMKVVNNDLIEQQKDEALQKKVEIDSVHQEVIKSNSNTKTAFENIIKEMRAQMQTSIAEIKSANNILVLRQDKEISNRTTEINKINKSIIDSSENAKLSYDDIANNMTAKTSELTNELTKEFNLLIDSIKDHASTSENAISASSSRLVNAAKKYDRSINTQNDLIDGSKSILNQLELLIKQREDEFKKYEWYEKQLTETTKQLQLT